MTNQIIAYYLIIFNIVTFLVYGIAINVLPLAHPRQIGALGSHSEKWNLAHIDWEKKRLHTTWK